MEATVKNIHTVRRIGGFMVKAKDFWDYLCEKKDYRFFAGVACPGLAPLYKKMNADIMHYIPAANERIALGLVSGAHTAGFKGGILLDMRYAYDLSSLFEFNIDYKIPFLIIGYGDKDSHVAYDFPRQVINNDNFKSKLDKVIKQTESENVPGLIVFEEGIL
jgi:hypothetical protein